MDSPPGEIGSLILVAVTIKFLRPLCVVFNNKDFFSINLLSSFPTSFYYINPKSLHTWDMWAVSLAARAPHFRPEPGGCGGGGGSPEGVHRM